MGKSALILVDVQNDFLPGGSLAVPDGHLIIPVLNRLMHLPFDFIIATADFHLPHHSSFASTWEKKPGEYLLINGVKQILWPDHCVQGSFGAHFSSELDLSSLDKIIYKGTLLEVDSYSAFFDNKHNTATGLESYLHEQGISELYFAGLATDYCVLYSVRHAHELGFHSTVIVDACKGIDLHPGDIERAFEEMKRLGVILISSTDVESQLKARNNV